MANTLVSWKDDINNKMPFLVFYRMIHANAAIINCSDKLVKHILIIDKTHSIVYLVFPRNTL